MAYRDLKEFVALLRRRGELKEIAVEVDPHLEIAEITNRVVKRGGPALLFTRVKGHRWPVLINAFGTMHRMALALEAESLDSLAQELADLFEPKMPASLIGKLSLLPRLKTLADMFPRLVSHGACQEVVITHDPSLDLLPIIQCWPMDGGPYITLPVVITKHPERGTRNLGMYRLQKFDSRTLGVHWQPHKGGAHHYRVAEAMGRRLEVAIALGPDPAVTYSATAPLPEEMDELLLAGLLRHEPVELVKCQTIDLEVPANSQIVLEGYVEPGERRREGPFGDHTGFYSLAEDYPVFHLTAITHQRNPIYPTLIVGVPPMEDGPLGKATERLFLPFLKRSLPEIVDINLPIEGIFHNLAIVSIHKRYPGHARKVMHAIWGLGQLMFTKIVVVVDADCNVHDLGEVLWRVGTAIDPKRDVLLSEGPTDALDFAAQLPGWGGKLGIDATTKWPEEGYARSWPPMVKMSPEVKARVDALWETLGL